VEVPREGGSLLDALRDDLGVRSVKDGCSPQGQCGCCTVLVDGAPRVACVTPLRRVAGRSVTTADGLDPKVAARLVDAFVAHGASQCGFCTPGILCRLAPLGPSPSAARVETALLAHLCRCTGWRSIVDAACGVPGSGPPGFGPADAAAASRRASLEGGAPQRTGAEVVLGRGGFADDTAPAGCLVAVPDLDGGWAVGETLAEARAASGKVQGRRSGQELRYPVAVPPGDWDLTLQTTWVEPGYLEPDSSWCAPGGEPAHPAGNGGAFGGKVASGAPAAAQELAARYGRPVRVVFSREDVVRLGPKRPPVAAGMRLDGTGVVRVVAAPGVADAIRRAAPGVEVVEVDGGPGPAVSAAIRAAGWAEAAVVVAAAEALAEGRVPAGGGVGTAVVSTPEGARAEASVTVDPDGRPGAVEVAVCCGDPLDETVLRSYVTGAAHMALGWVCSEAIAVGPDGVAEDLTIRSFGILQARHTPPIRVRTATDRAGGAGGAGAGGAGGAGGAAGAGGASGAGAGGAADDPVRGSDAVFAAVAAATWIAQGLPPRWPTRRGRTP
jgi:xanthine dehydrogenase small subunit